MLDTIACAKPLVKEGINAPNFKLQTRSYPLIQGDFSALKPWTRFPYAVLMPQSITENILTRLLQERGIQVVRPLKLCGLQEVRDGLEASFEGGHNVKARYVIAADGSRSTVISSTFDP